MRAITERGNLWELAVLALLREEPMHPYQMQRLLRDRHEDAVLGLKRGSLYHAIHRLGRAGLIEAVAVAREGRRPERTTYRLTAAGGRKFVLWLRQRIATPQTDPSEFMGSISFLVHLTPKDAVTQLTARARAIEAQILSLSKTIGAIGGHVARVHLIEAEYQVAMQRAEAEWVRAIIAEVRSGRFSWDLRGILKQIRAARGSRTPARRDSHER
jgi:DNA-binding PadR family transcriptional regulator